MLAVLPAWTIPASSGVLAVTPDLDLDVPRLLGFPPISLYGHRGLFHSPIFLIAAAAILGALMTRRVRRSLAPLAILWAACMLTHPLLDALSDGGAGVMLLLPFSSARIFFPWRPIHVASPLESEWPFCLAALAIGLAVRWLCLPNESPKTPAGAR